MTAVNNLSELFPSSLDTVNNAKKGNELGQDDFLELMVAQMENQDPTKPMDNFQFLSQIAQFGTVEGIQDLQDGINEMVSTFNAAQTLQAGSMVGRHVVSDTNVGRLSADTEEPLGATVNADGGALNATLYVQDAAGALVYTRELGHLGGDTQIQWDGTNTDGDRLAAGDYRISVEGMVNGQRQALNVNTHNRVESVTVDGGNVTLNLDSGASINIGEVKAII